MARPRADTWRCRLYCQYLRQLHGCERGLGRYAGDPCHRGRILDDRLSVDFWNKTGETSGLSTLTPISICLPIFQGIATQRLQSIFSRKNLKAFILEFIPMYFRLLFRNWISTNGSLLIFFQVPTMVLSDKTIGLNIPLPNTDLSTPGGKAMFLPSA